VRNLPPWNCSTKRNSGGFSTDAEGFYCRAADLPGFLKLLFDKRPSATVKREACKTCNSCSGSDEFGDLDQDVDQGIFSGMVFM
jgi:hypothetical protein